MTREEERAIEVLKHTIPYTSEFADARRVAIRSIEAWDEIIKHLEATAKELLDREDEKQSHAYAKGITFAVSMIKNHMKEVEK